MIHRERRVDYADRNRNYNNALTAKVSDILQTETEVPNYIPSGRFDPNLPSTAADEPFFDVITKAFERPQAHGIQFDLANLGEYECVLLSSVAWSPYTVHCLVGEMGSGKTAVAKHLAGVLRYKKLKLCEHCTICEPLVVRIDFNEGFTSQETNALRRTFKRRLYEQLRTELRAQFKSHLKVDDFINFAQKAESRALFAAFDEFFEKTDDASWRELSNARQANELFGYISRADDMEHKLEMLMRLLRYIVIAVRREPACAILIFDNLDRLSSESQMTLMLEIFPLQRHARSRILIPLRRTTFEKLASQRAYSFGVINHNGPDPIDIARDRIEYYLTRFGSEPLTSNLDSRYSSALQLRLRYVHELLGAPGPNRIVDLLRGLSGESVRLGLHVVHRMFINNVVAFDRDPKNPDELAWAVLAGTDKHLRLDVQDPLIANVFTNGKTDKPSLLLLRILGVLYEFDGNSSRRTIGNLLTIGKAVGGWSQREIIEAVNYLMLDRRPLVWVDGRSKFSTATDATGPSSREVLFLTSSGRRYFRNLIMSLSYFQEAVLGLEWSDNSIPAAVQMDELNARFRALRACFRQLQEIDRREVEAFKQAGVAEDTLTPVLVTNRILYGLAKSAYLIFESQRTRGIISSEFIEWYNLVLNGFNLEHGLLSRRNTKLNELLREYGRHVKLYRYNSSAAR